jgi:hypothetical protein
MLSAYRAQVHQADPALGSTWLRVSNPLLGSGHLGTQLARSHTEWPIKEMITRVVYCETHFPGQSVVVYVYGQRLILTPVPKGWRAVNVIFSFNLPRNGNKQTCKSLQLLFLLVELLVKRRTKTHKDTDNFLLSRYDP